MYKNLSLRAKILLLVFNMLVGFILLIGIVFYYEKSMETDTYNAIHSALEYEIKEKLGEGAYGCVYKVQHKTTQFLRAVKAIKRKHVDSTVFSNEIAVLKTVDHPNIIKLFDCYYDNNYF